MPTRITMDAESDVCDGYGCYSRAECTVQLKVGKQSISLSLCQTCKKKFEEYSESAGKQNHHKKSMKVIETEIKERHNGGKIIKSPESTQVRGRKIPGVLNISVGVDMSQ